MPARGKDASAAIRRSSTPSSSYDCTICSAYQLLGGQSAQEFARMLTLSPRRRYFWSMAHTTTLAAPAPTVASRLLGWDHLEWWVGNARAVTAWLTSGFGFEVVAYAGPETGVYDRASYVLAQ